jgi:hypothetical protein
MGPWLQASARRELVNFPLKAALEPKLVNFPRKAALGVSRALFLLSRTKTRTPLEQKQQMPWDWSPSWPFPPVSMKDRDVGEIDLGLL